MFTIIFILINLLYHTIFQLFKSIAIAININIAIIYIFNINI